MQKFDLEKVAEVAMHEGTPVPILAEFLLNGSIAIEIVAPKISKSTAAQFKRIANKNWKTIEGQGLFNGPIVAIQSIYTSAGSVFMDAVEIDYKTFRATDIIVERIDGCFPSLALGVHALLLGSRSILALKLADGKFGTPGGAVDISDFAGRGSALVNALIREIHEEVGIEIDQGDLRLCGIYITPSPVHLVFIYIAFIDDYTLGNVCFDRVVAAEGILGLASIDRDEICKLANSIHDALGLCISSANRQGYL